VRREPLTKSMRRGGARKGLRRGVLWGGAGLAALLVWAGCSVTKSNYAMLSFFFDGVPDPNAPGPGGAGAGDATLSAQVVVHKPFAEEKCESCHKTQYRPSRNDPTACLGCHDKVTSEHAWTHGAVAGGACLWCHSPHESARKWLLRGPDRGLCVQCHSSSMLKGDVVPAHADPKASCIACHFGHGGENALMLRPGATATNIPPAAEEESKPSGGARQATFGSDQVKRPDSTTNPATTPANGPEDIAPVDGLDGDKPAAAPTPAPIPAPTPAQPPKEPATPAPEKKQDQSSGGDGAEAPSKEPKRPE